MLADNYYCIQKKSIKVFKRDRGHNLKEQNRLDVTKYSFSKTTTNDWNKLSTDFVDSANNKIMFRNRIDKYLT